MIDLSRIITGLLLSVAIGGLAWWRRSLTVSGWLGAVITGTLTFGFGGWSWGLALIAFFVSSSLLSHYKERIKEQRAGEKFAKGGRRDFAQTMANGGIGAALALAYGLLAEPPLLLALFAGVLATVTGDTWATELGVLSPHQPRLITSGRPVAAGTSGGITALGTAAAAAGGLLIGVVLLLVRGIEGMSDGLLSGWWLLPASLLGGLGGALFDSLLGATVQVMYRYPDGRETERASSPDGTPHTVVRGWHWLNNDMVNLISSLVGGLVGGLLFLLLAA